MRKMDYPSTKEIIYLLGAGTLLTSSILFPGLIIGAGIINRTRSSYKKLIEQKRWEKFNKYLLKRNLNRLITQKIVKINRSTSNLELSKLGEVEYLKIRLEEASIKAGVWDGKWRIILYDISQLKKNSQAGFRRALKKVNFLCIQKSVYLTPYNCLKEIDVLKNYFNISKEVLFFETSKIAGEVYYRKYFGL